MRILIWVQQFYPNVGGIETQVMNLVQQLKTHGHECLILTEQTNEAWRSEEDWQGVKIYRFPFAAAIMGFKLNLITDIARSIQSYIDEFNPDILHLNVNIQRLALFRLFINKITNRPPTLISLHGLLEYEYNHDLDQFFDSVDWINCVSANLLQEFLRFHPRHRHKANYIYNGIQPSTLTPSPLPYHPVRILCLGRLTHEKGFDQAILAFYLITKKFANAELIIAGEGGDHAQIVDLVNTLKLNRRVTFLRKISPERVPGVINQVTMLVVPSRYETFGIAAIEAGLLARPVIAMKVGGLQEIFTHQETGLLVEHEDVDGLAAQMEYLIQHPEIAHAIGKRGYEHVLKTFNAKKMFAQYAAIYTQLAAAREQQPYAVVD